MKKFKGTKGPWVLELSTKSFTCLPDLVEIDELKALNGRSIIEATYHGELRCESVHDAKLIAAAPELLEALSQLRDYVEHNYWGDGEELLVDSNHPMVMARKSINKALGEER